MITTNKIAELRSLPRQGIWEIARRADPILSKIASADAVPLLTIIVDQESYFVLCMRVAMPADPGALAVAFNEAVEKCHVLPGVIWVREEKLRDELGLIVKKFDITVIRAPKLKVVPQILRDLNRVLGSMQ